jgi:glycosyltransferase involved in cell wall biosynthesis
MPVYNGEAYLDEAIRSVLEQSWGEFEFVAFDDGSTDRTGAILRAWADRDSRIRVVTGARRLGPVGSSNAAVRATRGSVVARMDADDVSLAGRFQQQWEIIQTSPRVALVGSLWEGLDAEGRVVRPRDRWRLLWRSLHAPFPHGSIMFRRSAFDAVQGYRDACEYWEDLDLYLRLAECGRVLVWPRVLYRHRFHASSTLCSANGKRRMEAAERLQECLAARRAGRERPAFPVPAPVSAKTPRRLTAATLYSLGAPRMWAGHSPWILSDLRHVRLWWPEWSLPAVAILALWGAVNPRGVRMILRSLVRIRDGLASLVLPTAAPVEWRFSCGRPAPGRWRWERVTARRRPRRQPRLW